MAKTVFLFWPFPCSPASINPKVVPDFRSLETEQDGSLAPHFLQRLRDQVNKFMAQAEGGQAQQKGRAKVLKDKYLANRDNLQALDHTIKQGLDSGGLQGFLAERAPCALPPQGRRYLVSIDDLPEEVRDSSPGRPHRSCVLAPGADPVLECLWGHERRLSFFIATGDPSAGQPRSTCSPRRSACAVMSFQI